MSDSTFVISGVIAAVLVLLLGKTGHTVSVKGPIRLELGVVNGSLHVSTSPRPEVKVVASCELELHVDGDTVEIEVEELGRGRARRAPRGGLRPGRVVGACGKGCRLTVESHSGDVALALVPQTSAFALDFESASGDLQDTLGITRTLDERAQPRPPRAQQLRQGAGRQRRDRDLLGHARAEEEVALTG